MDHAADYSTYHAGPDVADDFNFACEVESYLRMKLELAAKRCGADPSAVTLSFGTEGFTVSVSVAKRSLKATARSNTPTDSLDEAIGEAAQDVQAWERTGYRPAGAR